MQTAFQDTEMIGKPRARSSFPENTLLLLPRALETGVFGFFGLTLSFVTLSHRATVNKQQTEEPQQRSSVHLPGLGRDK